MQGGDNDAEPGAAVPAVTVRTGDRVDHAGAWLPLEHVDGAGCAAEPRRHALPTALPAPGCPHCDDPVRWHLIEVPGHPDDPDHPADGAAR
jgi:hypothetical protein